MWLALRLWQWLESCRFAIGGAVLGTGPEDRAARFLRERAAWEMEALAPDGIVAGYPSGLRYRNRSFSTTASASISTRSSS